MVETVRRFIVQHELIKPHSTVIVGLSGGPDSVCLLSVLKELASDYQLRLIAGHLDHQWRTNSSADAQFCKELAASWGIEFRSMTAEDLLAELIRFKHSLMDKGSELDLRQAMLKKAVDKALQKYNGSKEEQGRSLRRAFFALLAVEYNADSIALAHHQDDQQETFFLRMIRGASISGLSGIKAQSDLYIRPLLPLYKHEIMQYVKQHTLPYVIDETNSNTDYLRNALRHNVLPALKACDERFDKSFTKTHEHISQTEAFLERATQTAYQAIAARHINENRTDFTNNSDKAIFENEYGVHVQKEASIGLTESAHRKKLQESSSIVISKFLEQDPFLYDRLLLKWLCSADVPFSPSTALFNEIIRFLKTGNSQHNVHESWRIIKQGDTACIVSA